MIANEQTMAQPTTEQSRAVWDQIAPRFDSNVTPHNLRLGEDVLERACLQSGMFFLDVAAGSGALSIPAARMGATVLATDLAPTMIERLEGRAKREGLDLQTCVMDGQALDLDDNSFDLTASQNGVSLFPDMARGLEEMVRVTKPGGRVMVVAVAGSVAEAEFISLVLGAIRMTISDFAGPPMDPPPLPFQVADPAVLRQRLIDAGLSEVRVEPATWTMEFESGATLINFLTSSNPLGAKIVDTLTDDQLTEVRRLLDDMLSERAGEGGTAVLTAPMNVGIGTKS